MHSVSIPTSGSAAPPPTAAGSWCAARPSAPSPVSPTAIAPATWTRWHTASTCSTAPGGRDVWDAEEAIFALGQAIRIMVNGITLEGFGLPPLEW